MPPKGKAGGKGKGGSKDGKGKSKKYEEKQAASVGSDAGGDGWRTSAAMNEVFKGTAVRLSDFDAKATQLMDALQEAGKSDGACKFLSKSLEGVSRDKVTNWRAYTFTLLRRFDKDFYEAMKEQRGRPRPRRKDEKTTVVVQSMTPLKATAPEFVPGQTWGGFKAQKEEPAAKDGDPSTESTEGTKEESSKTAGDVAEVKETGS
mmetsp:Transcript_115178/g.332708  ORF Transcript_115178/g.332708 Transcript_115178/m.332708 type:complete len:204 (+) Transcript_115178:125-736(+)